MKFISFSTGLFILIHMCQLTQSAKPQMSAKELQDFNLTTVEIIQKYGYPAEVHNPVTEDGYILELHRIPHGKKFTKPGFPILVGHSVTTDSSIFVLNGNRSLGFFLADQRYDVWLINFRGTYYARNHTSLSTEDKKFWDFSFHEFGIYDIPACINYIRDYTKNEDLLYLGFSMGTTSFFIFGSERPEYQKYIRGAVLLGPVAILKHSTSMSRFGYIPLMKTIEFFFEPRSVLGKFQDSATLQKLIKFGCNSTLLLRYLCDSGTFVGNGYSLKEFDPDTALNIVSHMSSTSTKVLQHYVQLFLSDEFHQYNYGRFKNLIKYKSPSPPIYHLESINIPMSLFIGLKDGFATPENTLELTKRLRSVKSVYVAPERSYNHHGYLFGKNVEKIVFPEIARRLKDFLKNGGVTQGKVHLPVSK